MPEKVILKVSGMHCNSCSRLIEMTLKDEDGVQSVTVNYPDGQASVEFDQERIDFEKLRDVIRGLGYEVIEGV